MYKREVTYLVKYLDLPVDVSYAMEALAEMQIEANSSREKATIHLEGGRLAIIIPGNTTEYRF